MIDWSKIQERDEFKEMNLLKKRIKTNFLRLFLVLLGVVLCVRCTTDSSLVVVDNPSDRTITFTVDEKVYTLDPKESMELSLALGEHTLTNPSGKRITFTKQEYEEKSLLNPLEETYVIVTTAYTDSNKEENFLLEQMFQLIELNGRYYYGPFQLVNAPYTARTTFGDPWHYGLDEDFEDRITINATHSTSINIRKAKIYRAEDFEKNYADYEIDPSELN